MNTRWTRTALANLDAIAQYIARDNRPRAVSFVGEIRDKIEMLSRFPGLGRPGRVAGTRELVVHENYIVAFWVKAADLQIIRVQHVARLWPPRL